MLQKYGAFRAFVQMYDKKSVFRAKKQQRALIFHSITENKEQAAGPQNKIMSNSAKNFLLMIWR